MNVTTYTSDSQLAHPWRLFALMRVDIASSSPIAWRLALRNIRGHYRRSLLGLRLGCITVLMTTVIWVILSAALVESILNPHAVALLYRATRRSPLAYNPHEHTYPPSRLRPVFPEGGTSRAIAISLAGLWLAGWHSSLRSSALPNSATLSMTCSTASTTALRASTTRGILNHQYLDAENDVTSGVTTFATRCGRERTLWLLARVVLPAEIVCFAALVAVFSLYLPGYALAVVAFVFWCTFRHFGLALAHLAFFRTGPVTSVRYNFSYIPAGIVRMARKHV